MHFTRLEPISFFSTNLARWYPFKGNQVVMALNVNKWKVLKIPKVHADSLKVAWLHKTNLQTMYFPFSWTMKQRKNGSVLTGRAKVHKNHAVCMVGALPLLWEQLSKQYAGVILIAPGQYASPSQGYPQQCIARTHFIHLAPVVDQTMDSAIHRINLYPVDLTQ